jgi:type II secretory pathway pseudopilin PulG
MTVVSIIAILIALFIPALAKVRMMVKETQQKAQLNTIGLALAAFKNDTGDYPPSDFTGTDYEGGQKLAEALLGYDLLGFHPDSDWQADGQDLADNDIYVHTGITSAGLYPSEDENLNERKNIYIENGTKYAFTIEELFGSYNQGLEQNTYVICDVFDFKKIDNASVGAPILYYKANINNKTINYNQSPFNPENLIYNHEDNEELITAKEEYDNNVQNKDVDHTLNNPADNYKEFYDFIHDPKIPDPLRPYRPDTYLLISAGADGVYGTNDDITNFK